MKKIDLNTRDRMINKVIKNYWKFPQTISWKDKIAKETILSDQWRTIWKAGMEFSNLISMCTKEASWITKKMDWDNLQEKSKVSP